MMILRFLKENFTIVLIAILILLLYIQSCFAPPTPVPGGETVRIDTVWKERVVYVQSQPKETKKIPPTAVDKQQPKYQPDSNCAKLKEQFTALVDEHLTTHVYQDTLRADSSYIAITDTVKGNKLQGRSATFSLKTPVITKEITRIQTQPKRNQLYLGMEATSPLNLPGLENVSVGILLKNKQDRQLKASIGYNFPLGRPNVSLGYYQKLTFRR